MSLKRSLFIILGLFNVLSFSSMSASKYIYLDSLFILLLVVYYLLGSKSALYYLPLMSSIISLNVLSIKKELFRFTERFTEKL